MKRFKISAITVLVFFMILFFSIDIYARENAFIATLFDDASMQWRTSVMITDRELEKEYITGKFFLTYALEYMQTPEIFNKFKVETNLGGATDGNSELVSVSTTIKDGNGELSIMPINRAGATLPVSSLLDISENIRTSIYSAPLTFPSCENACREADINRAYTVASTLGNSLNDALMFLNDGKSFSGYSETYFKQLTYLLLSAYPGEDGVRIIKNDETGIKYQITYNSKNDTCTIKRLSDKRVGKFRYRVKKGYVYSESLTKDMKDKINAQKKAVTETHLFYYSDSDSASGGVSARNLESELKKNNFQPYIIEGEKSIHAVRKFEDGTKNYLSHDICYAGDTEYVTWFQMIYEAKLMEVQGIVYNTQGDLLEISGSEKEITRFVRNTLSGITDILGCYTINQLIFNEGIRGTKAFFHGLYYSSWSDSVQLLYLISSTIALSVVIFAVISAVNLRNITTLSSVPFARYNLIESIKDIAIAIIMICIFFPAINLLYEAGDSLMSIFREFSATDRCRELKTLSSTTGTLSAVIVQVAYFFIEMYLNIVYLIRGILIALLTSFAPLFIVCYAFPGRVREIPGAWFSELIGNYIIQPVHVLVISFLMSTNTGLRGIEAIVFVAVLIPATNLLKGIVNKGGGLAPKLAGTLTAGGTSMVGSATNTAMSTMSSASNGIMNGISENMAPPNSISSAFGKRSAYSLGASIPNSNHTTQIESNGRGLNVALSGNNIETIPSYTTGKSIPQVAREGAFNVAKVANAATSIGGQGIGGLVQMGAGAGMFVALAGSDPSAAHVGTQMMNSGGRMLSQGVGEIGYGIGAIEGRITDASDKMLLEAGQGRVVETVQQGNYDMAVRESDYGTQIAYKPYNAYLQQASLSSDKKSINYGYKQDRRLDNLYSLKESNPTEYRQQMNSLGFSDLRRTSYESEGETHYNYIVSAPNTMKIEKVDSSKGYAVGLTKLSAEETKASMERQAFSYMEKMYEQE